MRRLKRIWDFFRLWIKWGDWREAWEDAKLINDPKIQDELNQMVSSLGESVQFKKLSAPCRFDHNGECIICDCWPEYCAYSRMLAGDYSFESKEELEEMFKET
jgi:hypothetical protein